MNNHPPDDSRSSTADAQKWWLVTTPALDRWATTLEIWLAKATGAMVSGAGIEVGHRVLDVAAGPGGQTIDIAKRVGQSGSVLAVDISERMLGYARLAFERAGIVNATTAHGSAEKLESADETFDAAVCRLGLMHFDDPEAALAEAFRVLKPGGKFASVVFSTAEKNGALALPVEIARKSAGLPLVPGPLKGPFGLGGDGTLDRLYRSAGFASVKVDRLSAPLRMISATACAEFQSDAFGAVKKILFELPEVAREQVWSEIAHALRKFDGSDGFVGPCELLVAVGQK